MKGYSIKCTSYSDEDKAFTKLFNSGFNVICYTYRSSKYETTYLNVQRARAPEVNDGYLGTATLETEPTDGEYMRVVTVKQLLRYGVEAFFDHTFFAPREPQKGDIIVYEERKGIFVAELCGTDIRYSVRANDIEENPYKVAFDGLIKEVNK